MVTDASGASHRFAALDALRGIAALGVALHHIVAVNGPASWSLLRNGGHLDIRSTPGKGSIFRCEFEPVPARC